MGASNSKIEYINNYEINNTGSNNSIPIGDIKQGGSSSKATLDAAVEASVPFTTGMNPTPGFFGKLKGVFDKAKVFMKNNPQIVNVAKEIATGAIKLAGNNAEEKQEAEEVYEEAANLGDADSLVKGDNLVKGEFIQKVALLQKKNVENLPKMNDAFETVTQGASGIRNAEVTSEITRSNVLALAGRLSDTEVENKDEILALGGNRLGICVGIPKPEPDMLTNTIESTVTKFGKVSTVRDQALDAKKRTMHTQFKVLHNESRQVAKSGIVPNNRFTAVTYVGLINEHAADSSVAVFGSSFKTNGTLVKKLKKAAVNTVTKEAIDSVVILPNAYSLPKFIGELPDQTRKYTVVLSGYFTAIDQPFRTDGRAVSVGVLYNTLDDRVLYNPGFMANIDNRPKSKELVSKLYSSPEGFQSDQPFSFSYDDPIQYGSFTVTKTRDSQASPMLSDAGSQPVSATNLKEEIGNILGTDTNISAKVKAAINAIADFATVDNTRDVKSTQEYASALEAVDSIGSEDGGSKVTAALLKVIDALAQRSTLYMGDDMASAAPAAPAQTFSYLSSFQITCNLSAAKYITTGDLINGSSGGKPFNCVMVVNQGENQEITITVTGIHLEVTPLQAPLTLRKMGQPYEGKILEALGTISDGFASSDPQEIDNVWGWVIEPFINYLERIAAHHIKTGAAYNHSVDVVKYCLGKSGLDPMPETAMKEYIYQLILSARKWMSDEGPLKPYTPICRQAIAMHFMEHVVPNTNYHIDVYTINEKLLIDEYVKDVDEYNKKLSVAIDKPYFGEKITIDG
uniref:Uncharacterized protein n=1 Tax=French Guiana reovirus TaxID=2803189 RepID=A0A7T8G1Y1_9REOV|nr:hypothetical protein [French Guiana reovirus]